jgi:hypothetical protein
MPRLTPDEPLKASGTGGSRARFRFTVPMKNLIKAARRESGSRQPGIRRIARTSATYSCLSEPVNVFLPAPRRERRATLIDERRAARRHGWREPRCHQRREPRPQHSSLTSSSLLLLALPSARYTSVRVSFKFKLPRSIWLKGVLRVRGEICRKGWSNPRKYL